MVPFGEREYWDRRFAGKSTRQLHYCTPAVEAIRAIEDILQAHTTLRRDCSQSSWLELGCGAAPLAPELLKSQLAERTCCVDYSASGLAALEPKKSVFGGALETRQLDVTSDLASAFSPRQFDFACEKSLIDTFLTRDDSTAAVGHMLLQAAQVVRPGGLFFCIDGSIPQGDFAIYLKWPGVLAAWDLVFEKKLDRCTKRLSNDCFSFSAILRVLTRRHLVAAEEHVLASEGTYLLLDALD